MRNCRSGVICPSLLADVHGRPPFAGRSISVTGDFDGKEQAIHQSQAMAPCFVPRRAWVASASR
jgi:hypothetical protein